MQNVSRKIFSTCQINCYLHLDFDRLYEWPTIYYNRDYNTINSEIKLAVPNTILEFNSYKFFLVIFKHHSTPFKSRDLAIKNLQEIWVVFVKKLSQISTIRSFRSLIVDFSDLIF